jgi:hypothetical protein
MQLLESFRINIRKCRRMNFGNAADIEGKYLDLQARLENSSSAIRFAPQSNNSLHSTENQ